TLVVDWGLAKPLGRCFETVAAPAATAARAAVDPLAATIDATTGAAPGPQPPAGDDDPTLPLAEKPLTPSSLASGSSTIAGVALGTPQFMSPEQASGELDRLGPASDIYSLGATLYVLLTGRVPFEETRVERVLERVHRGDFPPPRAVLPAVPPALDAICRRAMAQRPEDRYASA